MADLVVLDELSRAIVWLGGGGGGLYGIQRVKAWLKSNNGTGPKVMSTEEHERLCSSRLGSISSDVKEIKQDFKSYINSRQE
jgi:hypothetical protein